MKQKLGDRITIEINRERRPSQSASTARDLRHGPERRLDDPKDNPGSPNIMLIDCSMKWQDFGDDSHLEGNESPLPAGVMAYVQRGPELYVKTWTDETIAGLAEEYRVAIFNKDSVKLEPFTGAEYRKIERGMPLPFRGVDTLNLSIKIGPRAFPVREGAQLKKATPADKRLEIALAASHLDAALIDALQKEVAESNFATGQSICREDVIPQLWFTHTERDQRELWGDFGLFKPRMQQGAYSLAVDSPLHFESFDLLDRDNFKVVRRFNSESVLSTFDNSEEVNPRRLQVLASSRLAKVFLIPQPWKFVITYTQQALDTWDDHQDNENSIVRVPWSREVSDSGYMPAFSSPFVVSGWETPTNGSTESFTNHPAYLHAVSDTAYNPQDATDASFLRFMMQLSLWQAAAVDDTPHIILPEPHTDTPPSDPFLYFYSRSDLVAQTNATAVVTQEGCPAKALVGAVEFADDNNARYYVYRKTAREIEPVTIYSGSYDDPGYNSVVSGLFFVTPACMKRVISADWTGTHPANRWTWSEGGLCDEDSLWPYLMQPRWCEI